MSELEKIKKACFATKCIMFAYGLMFPCLVLIIPYMKISLAIDDAQLGTLLFCFGIGGLLCTPVIGVLIKYFGTWLVTLISGLFIAINLPLLVMANTPFYFAVGAFCFGIARNALNIAINSQAVTIEKKLQISLMSNFHFVFSSAGIFGGIIGSLLLMLNLDVFWCILALSIFIGLIFLIESKHLLSLKEEIDSEQRKEKLSFPGIRVFLLGVICFVPFVAEGAMLNWSGDFLQAEHGFDLSAVGVGYAIFSLAMAIGRLVGDKLKQLFGFTLMFQASALICGLGFVLSVYFKMPYGVLLGFFMTGLGAANIVPIIITTAGAIDRAHSSITLAYITTIGGIIAQFGPTAIGYLAKMTSLSFAFLCVGGLVASLALCGSVIRTKATEALANNAAG